MPTRRQKRVEELLRDEIMDIIRRDLTDSHTPVFSITTIHVSKDFSHAKIFLSFLDGRGKGKFLLRLKQAEGYIRSEVNKGIRLRRIPKLDFEADETIAKAFELEELFERINRDDSGSGTGNS